MDQSMNHNSVVIRDYISLYLEEFKNIYPILRFQEDAHL